MQRSGTLARKTRTRVFDSGNFQGHTEYLIESEAGARPAPQAFLVHQLPGWVLPTHYHLEDQFQVVVGGSGTLGAHALAPATIHYASREAGYGPIVAGPEGLDYFTLRSVTDPGAWYLPEERAKMRMGIRKRQETVGPIAVAGGDERRTRLAASVEELIAPDSSGLAAWAVRLPPGQSLTAPVAGAGGGRYHVVLAGSLVATGADSSESLPVHSCVYASPDESPLQLVAGADGLDLLVLQYPAATLAAEPQWLKSPAA